MNSDINARYQSASELLREPGGLPQQQAAANLGSGSDEDLEILDVITPDVHPIASPASSSKEKYARRRRRSRKVSILSGRLRRAGVPHRRVRFPLELLAA